MTGHDARRRDELKVTFDAAAALYQRARPEYPAELFDEVVRQAGLERGDRLLEVGCATGKATIPMVKRGFDVTCVELGAKLAEAASGNLADFVSARVITAAFETWHPAEDDTFALVFAATAWDWLDPAVRYRKAWELLRPGGHIALWGASHVFPDGGDPFFYEIQEVYDEIGEALPPGAERLAPGNLPDRRDEILATGMFERVFVRHFDWEVEYDADGYIDLLRTFSNHIAMEARHRDHLFAEVRRRLAQRADGRLRRHWGAVLNVATRID